MMQMFFADIAKEYYPDVFANIIQKKFKGDISAYIDEMYSKSIFTSKDRILEFLVAPDYKKLDKDLGYITMLSVYDKYNKLTEEYLNVKQGLKRTNRLFVTGIMQMDKDKKFYPDANRSMRLTYGKVCDYISSATGSHKFYTTLDDMVAKEDPKNPDFGIPAKLKQLYENKDYGRYATDGEMRIDFLTNTDVSGGVSGSPVINGDGELTGLVFDINYEGTSQQFQYNENFQRTISVDIKFVLFIVDKYAGATNLIKELTIRE